MLVLCLVIIILLLAVVSIWFMREFYRCRAMLSEISNKYEDLLKTAAVSVQANKTKSEFLANVTHELRSPLGAILGYTELLWGHDLSEAESYAHIQSIKRNGRHLLSIINDILDLSKIEAGLLEVEQVTFSLHLELLNIIATYKKEAARKGLQINVSYDFPVPECIVSDPTRLRQIIINLMSNAIKFTDRGEVTVSVSFSKGLNTVLNIRVTDTGIGISRDQQEKLFQSFIQADPSITRKYGGTGLGLALSRRIARAMGGDLILEASDLNKGSTFCLQINPGNVESTRWLKSHKELNNIPLPSLLEKKDNSLDGISVLIVEDSKDNQAIYLQYLESAGAEVDLADDGHAGFKKAMSNEYNLILMDIQMPELDGYATTKKLRNNEYKKPIIALTANAMKGERERCIESGCDDYLTKPVDPDTLTEIISWVIKGKLGNTKLSNLKKLSYLSSINKEQLLPIKNSDDKTNCEIRSIYENDPRVSRVIGGFVQGLNDKVGVLKSAVEQNDYGVVSTLAHNLRGSSATYGFPELAAMAEKLEIEALSEPDSNKIMQNQLDNIQTLAVKIAAR